MSPFVRVLPPTPLTLQNAVSRPLLLRSVSRPSSYHVYPHPRCLSSSRRLAAARRTADFNSGFTGTYDPSIDTGRGPMFSKTSFGVPQFYPRDLKKRVDDYVVGQDRAKKTICATIFNHYQNLRRRHQNELEDRNLRDKTMRQRFARDRELHQKRREMHPVEGQRVPGCIPVRYPADNLQDDFPGHNEAVRHLSDNHELDEDVIDHLYQPDDPAVQQHVKIDKSNLLLVGPTGVGKTYILE